MIYLVIPLSMANYIDSILLLFLQGSQWQLSFFLIFEAVNFKDTLSELYGTFIDTVLRISII
jgi:hypothetical protein